MRSRHNYVKNCEKYELLLFMHIRLKSIFTLVKEAFAEWQEDKASLLAAALAYYTVFSITPLLVSRLGILFSANFTVWRRNDSSICS